MELIGSYKYLYRNIVEESILSKKSSKYVIETFSDNDNKDIYFKLYGNLKLKRYIESEIRRKFLHYNYYPHLGDYSIKNEDIVTNFLELKNIGYIIKQHYTNIISIFIYKDDIRKFEGLTELKKNIGRSLA